MFYEDRVSSFEDLRRRLAALDQDAGVRVLGRSGGKRYFVFVTRFGARYTVMTYTIGRGGAPGKRVQTQEIEGADAVEEALKMLAKGRLRAWVY